MTSRLITSDRVRSFTFGVEDSLVSTVGLVSGIAVVGTPRSAILLTGVVLVFVEAFSMSVGSLVSDNSAKEFEEKAEVPLRASVSSAVVMFVSYLFSGFVVLSPYMFLEGTRALYASIGLSIIALFILGVASAKAASIHPMKKAMTMVVVGGLAIAVGMGVGMAMGAL